MVKYWLLLPPLQPLISNQTWRVPCASATSCGHCCGACAGGPSAAVPHPSGPAAIHEVPGVLIPALRIPLEPRRAGGLWVLDPSLLLHHPLLRTAVPLNGLLACKRQSPSDCFGDLAGDLGDPLIPQKSIGATGFEPAT